MAKQFETQQDSSLCKTHRHLCFVAATLYLHPAVYTVLRDEYHVHHIPHRRHSHKKGPGTISYTGPSALLNRPL